MIHTDLETDCRLGEIGLRSGCKKSWAGYGPHDWEFENPDPRPRIILPDGRRKLRIGRHKCTKCGAINGRESG